MDYDGFRRVFLAALADSKLPTIGFAPAKEVLDLHGLDRTCTIYVQPIGHDARDLFQVSGEIFWRWDALHTARTRTTEEDLLTVVLGHPEHPEPIFAAPNTDVGPRARLAL